MLSRAPPRPEALFPSAQNASWLCDGCNTFHAACESRPRRVLGLLICPSCRSKSETEGGEGSSGLLAEGAAKRARTAVQRLGHNDSWGEGQASRWASCEGGQAGTPWYSQAARNKKRKGQLQANESGEMLRRHSGSDTGGHSGSDTELQIDESDEEGAAAMMLFMPGRLAGSPEGGKRARSRTGSEAGTPGPLPAVVATELLAFAFSSRSGSYVSNAAHTNGAVKPLVAGRFEAQNQAREENVPIFEAKQHDEMSSLPPQPPLPSVATGDGTVAAQVWIGRYESRALASMDDVEQLLAAAQSGTAAARVGSQEKEQPAMWTVEEDLLIVDLVETIGKRWNRIAAALPGRTENGVRNRWNRMEKAQQVRKDKGDGHGYRCGRCGQPKAGHICPALTSGERLEGENLVKRATALSAMASRKISVQQAAQALDKERKAKGSSSRGLKGKLAKMGSSRILNVAELFDLVAGSSDP
mmetsp:Transcript_12544/g.41278  ORF Transcript_12544/g.41278 Transcript_12544/m.41278 type:complete len:471 (+) Transcript_12544:66-1478(+)